MIRTLFVKILSALTTVFAKVDSVAMEKIAKILMNVWMGPIIAIKMQVVQIHRVPGLASASMALKETESSVRTSTSVLLDRTTVIQPQRSASITKVAFLVKLPTHARFFNLATSELLARIRMKEVTFAHVLLALKATERPAARTSTSAQLEDGPGVVAIGGVMVEDASIQLALIAVNVARVLPGTESNAKTLMNVSKIPTTAQKTPLVSIQREVFPAPAMMVSQAMENSARMWTSALLKKMIVANTRLVQTLSEALSVPAEMDSLATGETVRTSMNVKVDCIVALKMLLA